MKSTVTIKDVAIYCKVSVSTVSRALNGHMDIKATTKKRILEAANILCYVPNNSAISLKKTVTKSIMVIVKGVNNSFFNRIIDILSEEIRLRDYSFLLEVTDEISDELKFAISAVKGKKPAGIIFLGGNTFRKSDEFKALNIPFVLCSATIDKNIDKSLYSSVSVNDEKESQKAIEYLINKGHKKIAILAADFDDNSIGKLRLSGYLKALSKYKIDEKIIHYTNCNPKFPIYSIENGYKSMAELLQKKCDFTAVFCLSDAMAVGATRAIIDFGKKVPDDISVVGFDGQEIGRYYIPRITTIVQKIDDMAKLSVDILFKRIKNNNFNDNVVLDGTLYEAESVREIKSDR